MPVHVHVHINTPQGVQHHIHVNDFITTSLQSNRHSLNNNGGRPVWTIIAPQTGENENKKDEKDTDVWSNDGPGRPPLKRYTKRRAQLTAKGRSER